MIEPISPAFSNFPVRSTVPIIWTHSSISPQSIPILDLEGDEENPHHKTKYQIKKAVGEAEESGAATSTTAQGTRGSTTTGRSPSLPRSQAKTDKKIKK